MIYVDPHVHLRDFEQSHKETVKHGLEVARDSGVVAVFDMPNTTPAIMTEAEVKLRLGLVKAADVPEVFYGLYMGVTADLEQVRRAIDLVRRYDNVVGMKMYAGHSTGQLGVTRTEDQFMIYETLAREGYDGLFAVHCEKEAHMHSDKWEPARPITHCLARPAEAEIASIDDQIAFAQATRFHGKLHIVHVSVPTAVDRVITARTRGLDISSGVCPHHLFYDWEQMRRSDGLLWKMNPPLREPGDPQRMLEYLRMGFIDWVETDHAPHTLDEKLKTGFASGIPGLPWWDMYAMYLAHAGFTQQRIEEVTSLAAIKRFGVDISTTEHPRVDRRADYPFNPYTAIQKTLGM